jgi:hypothetical protein
MAVCVALICQHPPFLWKSTSAKHYHRVSFGLIASHISFVERLALIHCTLTR